MCAFSFWMAYIPFLDALANPGPPQISMCQIICTRHNSYPHVVFRWALPMLIIKSGPCGSMIRWDSSVSTPREEQIGMVKNVWSWKIRENIKRNWRKCWLHFFRAYMHDTMLSIFWSLVWYYLCKHFLFTRMEGEGLRDWLRRLSPSVADRLASLPCLIVLLHVLRVGEVNTTVVSFGHAVAFSAAVSSQKYTHCLEILELSSWKALWLYSGNIFSLWLYDTVYLHPTNIKSNSLH